MKAVKLTAIAAGLLLSTSAMANNIVVDSGRTVVQTAMKPAAVSVEAGTLGVGGGVSWAVSDKTEIKAGWNGGNLDRNVDFGIDATKDNLVSKNIKEVLGNEFKGINGQLKVKAKLNNPYVGAQFRPFSNAITVGTGVILNKSTSEATLDAKGQLPVGDNAFYQLGANDTFTIKAQARNTLAPYVTVGLKPNLNSRFGVFGEVGAAYVGNYDVDLKAKVGGSNGKIAVTSNGQTVMVDASKVQERIDRKLENKSVLPVYPIVKVGATLRF